jgi:Domain of unknown function (DUF4920)
MMMLILLLLAHDGPHVYGAGVKQDTPAVTIEALMANPEAYLGKVVKVKGTVSEVCPKAGCWMDIANGADKVRIKVKDGEIVFDSKMEGKTVIAEGTVYKFDLSKEEAVGYFKHIAEEKGQPFDPASVTAGTTIYQIGGIGAMVLN